MSVDEDVDESAAQPRYLRVAAEIRRQLEDGRLAAGDRVPPAHRWQERCGVSRVTVRRALDALTDEGWLERRGERRLFVRARPAESGARSGLLQVYFDPKIHSSNALFPAEIITLFADGAEAASLIALPRDGGFVEFVARNPASVSTRVLFHGGYEPTVDDERWLRRQGSAAVVIGRAGPGCGIPQINGAHVQGGWTLTRHLLQLGHRRILLVSEPTGHVVHDWVLEGYRRALAEAGVPFDPALVRPAAQVSVDAGAAATAAALAEGVAFSAVIAVDCWIACGMVAELRRRGRALPEDVATAVYFHQPWVDEICHLPMTGVTENWSLLVEQARELLDRQQRGEPVPPGQTVANLTLTVRRSCGAYPG